MKGKKTYYIKTFGCQANQADSEKVAGWYEGRGFFPVGEIDRADEVIINTCSVRHSAESRVYGLIHNLAKKTKERPKIVLTGCILRHSVADLKRKLPQVDEFLRMEEIKDTPTIRTDTKHALVSIMEGCDNFCTYCVVPYARGRETSRPFKEIVCEVEELGKRGYTKITLLGQNVNSYGKGLKPKKTFAELLKVLHELKGIQEIKFLTSNPWGLTDEIIQSIKLPRIDKNLHLPVQSGDDTILKKMNRRYSSQKYLGLIDKIRKEIPKVKISTDIIVGFPGETKEQFQNTVNLCKKVKFSKAYIAMYSPRSQTAAYKFQDDVPHKEKRRRWRVLEELINTRN